MTPWACPGVGFSMESDLRGAADDKTTRPARLARIAERGQVGRDIEIVVFDLAGNSYHGRVAAVADGARAGGLKF